MDENIRLITEWALARTLKEFALKVGIGEEFADILAQVHVKSSNLLNNWMRFIESNCAGCAHKPSGCAFLNPTEDQCSYGATPKNTKKANVTVIENGVVKQCPVFEKINR
jgi:hypothetical protein